MVDQAQQGQNPSSASKLDAIDRQSDVRLALREIGAGGSDRSRSKVTPSKRLFLFTFAVLCAGALTIYLLGKSGVLPIPRQFEAAFNGILLGVAICGGLIFATTLIEEQIISRVAEDAARFNLRRIVRLIAGLAIALAILSLIFANWYTALVSLGVMSLILGFALQTPISSFIGWIYILVHTPYRVGDRIRIGDATGDVIDVGYFDTTLWEFGGQYLSTDHPSGRIIKFPNSNVLNSAVYNYSWPLFPYIWNEVKFNVAYGSDLKFVAQIMEEIAAEEIGAEMMERVRQYREILVKTPVDEIQVQERPVVLFRVSDNTWIEAIVRYLVDPKEAGPVKTRLIRKMLERLNSEQDRVMFPRSDAR